VSIVTRADLTVMFTLPESAMKTGFFSTWLISCLLISPALAEMQTLIINSSNYPPVTSPEKDGVLDQVYQEMARRAGVKIVIQAMPAAERSLINQNEGIDDGDVSRVFGLEKQYTNLIRVPEPVMRYEMVVFSRNAHFKVNGIESLLPYDAGIPNGWKILERNVVGTRSVTKLENGEQLFSMLDKDRIDIALIEKFQGMRFVKDMKIQNIRILNPPFLEGDWFMYVNKKHEALVPRLAAALKSMKEDGTYQRIFDTALKRYAL
jgi:polar amino acid transport system substrate-binding protein